MKFQKDGSSPKNGEVFVFGSNKSGIHGAGAALHAAKNFGALPGLAFGMVNESFAIPTKDREIRTMKLNEIKKYVNLFIEFANKRPHINFYITRVGCGLAGYKDSDIAPMFKGIGDNCSVAYEWKKFLEN